MPKKMRDYCGHAVSEEDYVKFRVRDFKNYIPSKFHWDCDEKFFEETGKIKVSGFYAGDSRMKKLTMTFEDVDSAFWFFQHTEYHHFWGQLRNLPVVS